MRKSFLLGLAVTFGVGGLALAQEAGPAVPLPAGTIIATRQAGFDLQGGNVGAMKAAIEAGLDVKPLADGAKALAAWGRVIPALFPDGTQTGNNTKARPEIWSDRAGFQKAAETFYANADKLAVLAEANDKAGFAAQYTTTTQSCVACHRSYRMR